MFWLETQDQTYWGNIVVSNNLYRVHRIDGDTDNIELVTFYHDEAYQYIVDRLGQ